MTLALDFKSATLYAVRIVLHEADTARLREALAQRMADAGSFFENEPVVIDASRVDVPVDWPALLEALRGHNLPPIGVVAEGGNLEAARQAGLVPVELPAAVARPPAAPALVSTSEPVPTPTMASAPGSAPPADGAPANGDEAGQADAEPEAGDAASPTDAGPEAGDAASRADAVAGTSDTATPEGSGPETGEAAASRDPRPMPAPAPTALVINRPLRSGQRVYARQSDVIVIGMVSQGAEVIADGNVHVYGPLRGKAMAGARGDVSARIFTTQLDAELLAVAGVYRVVEDKLGPELHNRPALVSLDGETLRIEALKS